MTQCVQLTTLLLLAPVAAGRGWRQQRLREEQGAQGVFGVTAAGLTYGATSGRFFYSTWSPPSVAYRAIRRPLLSQNQRVAAALAAACAGITLAREVTSNEGELAQLARRAGCLPLSVTDRFEGAWQRARARRADAERRRKDAQHKQWLRENTKQAVVIRRD